MITGVSAVLLIAAGLLLIGGVLAQWLGHWASTALDLASAALLAVVLVLWLAIGEWLSAAFVTVSLLVALAMFWGHRRDRHGPSDLCGCVTDE